MLDYSSFLGKEYEITVDRPAGSVHPKHPDLVYPINYGFIDGIFAEDGEEVDVYVIDSKKPLKKLRAKVIAIIHRHDDDENKLIAIKSDKKFLDEEILSAVNFQEKYYNHSLIRP